MKLLNDMFNFILLLTNKYNIDESHGIRHSMEVLHYAYDIYNDEINKKPELIEQKQIILTSALLHDLCDKKYTDENKGLKEIEMFLKNKLSDKEIKITTQIISTMSYSKVKKNGYPDLGEYQTAYHIVREADLLSAYDFERCIIYNFNRLNGDFEGAYQDATNLFNNRVLKHLDDNLFITDYSKKLSPILHSKSLTQINKWSKLIKKML